MVIMLARVRQCEARHCEARHWFLISARRRAQPLRPAESQRQPGCSHGHVGGAVRGGGRRPLRVALNLTPGSGFETGTSLDAQPPVEGRRRNSRARLTMASTGATGAPP